jgi:hypothetical protein
MNLVSAQTLPTSMKIATQTEGCSLETMSFLASLVTAVSALCFFATNLLA